MFESLSNEPDTGLDFLVQFDGSQPEVSADEQQRVTERFKNMLDDTFLTYVTSVDASKEPAGDIFTERRKGYEQLFLQKPPSVDDENCWRYSVIIGVSEFNAEDTIEILGERSENQQIMLTINTYKKKRDLPHAAVTYHINAAERVLRRTNPTIVDDIPEELIAKWPIDLATDPERLQEIEEANRQHRANQQLAREMGLDNQPVGMAEMTDLESFIQQPGFQSMFG